MVFRLGLCNGAQVFVSLPVAPEALVELKKVAAVLRDQLREFLVLGVEIGVAWGDAVPFYQVSAVRLITMRIRSI